MRYVAGFQNKDMILHTVVRDNKIGVTGTLGGAPVISD